MRQPLWERSERPLAELPHLAKEVGVDTDIEIEDSVEENWNPPVHSDQNPKRFQHQKSADSPQKREAIGHRFVGIVGIPVVSLAPLFGRESEHQHLPELLSHAIKSE